jgi:hypothetical protein
MRRHRHNLKPEQREKLTTHPSHTFPCSVPSIAASSHFAICC